MIMLFREKVFHCMETHWWHFNAHDNHIPELDNAKGVLIIGCSEESMSSESSSSIQYPLGLKVLNTE